MTEWKNRHPEMGVIAMTCTATGESFLAISKDTSVGFNRHRFQLSAGLHPNKALQALWRQHGEAGFACEVVRVLKYDNPHDDHTDALNKLLDACLAADPKARLLAP